jgi:hypothetical protein
MFAYLLSPDALQDLQDVWDFIASDNVPAADNLTVLYNFASDEFVRKMVVRCGGRAAASSDGAG